MSVSHIRTEEIQLIYSTLVTDREFVEYILKFSHFKEKTKFLSALNEAEKVKTYVKYMLQNMILGNSFAYLVMFDNFQEHENQMKKDWFPSGCILKPVKFLIDAMDEVEYNLYDNSGNMYCDPKYHKSFQRIYKFALEKFYRENK